jgi:hypothetical protein
MRGRLLLLALVANAAACAGQAAPSPAITLDTSVSAGGAVTVSGVPPEILQSLTRSQLSQDAWAAILRVSVATTSDSAASGDPPPAILGTYTIERDAIRFVPAFPFDPGRHYDVVYDSAAVPGSNGGNHTRVAARVSLPADRREPSTFVTRVYPTAQVLPENQLRLYVHFSAPMGLRGGADQVAIFDEAGREVVDPFLPLDTEFWNGDRTRYTLFLDPGRVKRGILPNQEMGRALVPGRRYTLVVKDGWRDAHGLPLKGDFRMEFRVGPAIERPLSMKDWKIEPPAAGTRTPLVVTFPASLDHGLLLRAMGIARDGAMLDGEIGIERGETRWTFTPREPWTAGGYELVALSFLEDLAGNRIGRAFEVDEFSRTDAGGAPSRFTRPFTVGSR